MALNTEYTQFFKKWFADAAPVAGVKANGTLTISGVVSDTQTCTIGSNVYEFDINNSITAGRIKVDVANLRNQATGTLTFSGVVADAETVTIGTRVYEFDFNDSITEGNVKVDISAGGTAATGTLTFSGATSDGETVVIGNRTYEFDTDNNVSAVDHVRVDISGGATAAASVTALVAAITGDQDVAAVIAVDGEGDTVVVTSRVKGTTGNNIDSTTTCANAAWGAAKLANATDCAATTAITALVSAITGDEDAVVTSVDGEGDTVVVTSIAKGTAGNAYDSTETCANAAWGAAKLSGGLDTVTAANAVTALVNAINTNDSDVTATDGAGDTVVVKYNWVGTTGNSIATTETMTNGAWGHDHLENGVYATPVNCPAFIIIEGVWYIADAPVTKYTEGGWKSATPA